MSFLPPHEVLEAVIKEGEEGEWTSFDDSQQGFRDALRQWAADLQVQLLNNFWACIALWGGQRPVGED